MAHPFCIFHLTVARSNDSLYLWSSYGHFVIGGRPVWRSAKRYGSPSRKARNCRLHPLGQAQGESLQEMKNSGNEAKKWLKTKEVTLLNDANYAHFVCQSASIRRSKEQKHSILGKTTRSFQGRGLQGAVTISRLHKSRQVACRGSADLQVSRPSPLSRPVAARPRRVGVSPAAGGVWNQQSGIAGQPTPHPSRSG